MTSYFAQFMALVLACMIVLVEQFIWFLAALKLLEIYRHQLGED